jgi:protein transport protein SEC61 subunit gamma and related proteins
MIAKAKTFFGKCARVWQILRKPNLHEFKSISKISLIGIALIGVIGFIVSILLHLF